MDHSLSSHASDDATEDLRFVSSETFADGSLLELVSSPNTPGQPMLLLHANQKTEIATAIKHRGHTYRAVPLSSDFAQCVLLPDGAKAYGSIKRLFAKIAKVLKQLSLPENQACLLAIWVISTWVSDQLFSPPTLWISGPDVVRVMRLFEILRRFCRRGMVVTGLTSAKLQFLPMSLRPTLLLCDPSLNVLKTLMQANFRGVLVPGSDGIARDLRCAKAIHTSTRDLPQPWASQTVHLPLSPLDDPARSATEETLVKLEKLFQPLLLQYRLDHWQTVRDSRFAADVPPAARELANALGACVQTDDELTAKLPTQLAALDNDPSCACSLDIAIMEVVWPRLHPRGTSAAVTELKMKAELTAEINTFSLATGEIQEFSAEIVGKRTALLGLDHRRTKRGSQLVLNSQTSRRIHQLAHRLAPEKRVPGCSQCERIAAPTESGV